MSWMEDLDNLKTNQFLEETEKSREEPVVRWLELKLHQEEKEQMVKKCTYQKKKTHKPKVSQIRKHNLQSDLKELVKST